MSELTLDLVARYPRPGLAMPGAFAFSPDGKTLTFLDAPDGGLRRVLCALDVATGERRVLFDPGAGVTDENVSREEQLRRERARLLHTGVTSYAWADDADVILVPLGGELWLVTPDARARRIGAPDDGAVVDPRISPDGTRVAFVRDGDLYVLDAATGARTRLTHDATDGVTNGIAEYIAQEEMGRARGHWWSADGEWIAFQQTDERHIPWFRIPHWGTGDPNEIEEHRYPFAGAANARVKLGVVRARGGEARWLDLGEFEYLARVAWHPDGRLFVQTLDRAQQRLRLDAFEVASEGGDGVGGGGARATLIEERQEPWINLHDDLRFVERSGEFVWSSERSGVRQLYLYARDGSLVGRLTGDEWPVDAVLRVDGERVAYLAATTPNEQQVFAVRLDGGASERLTTEPGMNNGVFARDTAAPWVHVHHSLREPPRAELHPGPVLHAPAPPGVDLVTPELFTFANRDGVTLHAMRYTPARLPAPLVVRVYGGPHAQTVGDSWVNTVDLRAQYLAARGFLVLSVDNRGSARRGIEFEAAIARRMGTVEIDDQTDGVRYAQAQGWVDGTRAGIYGWSYGGYAAIMAMLREPGVFRVGVAGAPVTDWAGYDTCYTERYMGTPAGNPGGYRDGSALEHASKLEGKLMLIHGMVDENVHFRHTARFLRALAEANKDVDLLVYPEERHMPRSERDRRNMEERVAGFFERHL
jgi:dipeptidyl-peptidase-4